MKAPLQFRPMCAIDSAEVFLLSQMRWQIFGSLTFRQERLPERVRLSMYFAMLRKVARQHNVFFSRLIWALRQEGDGKLQHKHIHFLLSGLPRHAVTPATCSLMSQKWERIGGGMARIAPYNHALNGVEYILKRRGEIQTLGGFESAKFGSNPDLMLSDSLWKLLKARQ